MIHPEEKKELLKFEQFLDVNRKREVVKITVEFQDGTKTGFAVVNKTAGTYNWGLYYLLKAIRKRLRDLIEENDTNYKED